MNLLNYIIRRLMLLVLVMFGVSVLVFGLMMLIPPGMRVAVYVQNEKVTQEDMQHLIEKHGLNDPAYEQYFDWVGSVFKGNFGYSVTAQAPVTEAFQRYFPASVELVLVAAPFIILLGIWLGTLGAVHKDKPLDHTTRVLAIVGYSLPTFWLGLLLMMLFYGYGGIFPPGVLSDASKDIIFGPEFQRVTGLYLIDGILNWNWSVVLDSLYHLALPTITLVILASALIMRLMRSSMLEALGQDYIRTAMAKGADRNTIHRKHARRNGLIPVITVAGILVARLLAGLIITETVFNRQGLGWWVAQAAIQLDIPAIMFNVLFLSVVFVIVNLIVDILYAYIDPRIRLS